MVNSGRKGKRLELEAAAAVRTHLGLPARRSAQACGKYAADLLDTGDLFIECKGRRRHAVLKWLDQAREEAGRDSCPIVLLRRDGDPHWYALLRLDDLGREFVLR